MALSKLTPIRNDGVEFIDCRNTLYYDKFRYRARFHCAGLELIWWSNSEDEIQKRFNEQKKRFKNANLVSVKQFFNWKKNNQALKFDKARIRIEGGVAAIFSNNLAYLKTLEGLGAIVDYTEVDNSVPEDTKYFLKEPKYKYRFHLKSKRVKDDFALKLAEWVDRYQGTNTVIQPSKALNVWLTEAKRIKKGFGTMSSWRMLWTSSHYYIEYDDESTLTLFMLMFDGMVHRKYKLLKRPD